MAENNLLHLSIMTRTLSKRFFSLSTIGSSASNVSSGELVTSSQNIVTPIGFWGQDLSTMAQDCEDEPPAQIMMSSKKKQFPSHNSSLLKWQAFVGKRGACTTLHKDCPLQTIPCIEKSHSHHCPQAIICIHPSPLWPLHSQEGLVGIMSSLEKQPISQVVHCL